MVQYNGSGMEWKNKWETRRKVSEILDSNIQKSWNCLVQNDLNMNINMNGQKDDTRLGIGLFPLSKLLQGNMKLYRRYIPVVYPFILLL